MNEIETITTLVNDIVQKARSTEEQIAALRKRVTELEHMPQAVGTIWERPSTSKAHLGDPEWTVYYIVHRRNSPYWNDGDMTKDRRERIGRGSRAKAEAEQRLANQQEYSEKRARLLDLESRLSKTTILLREVSRLLADRHTHHHHQSASSWIQF